MVATHGATSRAVGTASPPDASTGPGSVNTKPASPSVPLQAVHALVRASVPPMDVDREVAGQIAAVDALLPEICEAAAARCDGLR